MAIHGGGDREPAYPSLGSRQPVCSRRLLRFAVAAAVTPSMSQTANCWANASVESLFGNAENRLVHQRWYFNRDAARRDLFAYSKGITIVRRSTPPSLSPDQAEAMPASPGARPLRGELTTGLEGIRPSSAPSDGCATRWRSASRCQSCWTGR